MGGGAWCPLTPLGRDSQEWIQIVLQSLHRITAVATQGRYQNGTVSGVPQGRYQNGTVSVVPHWVTTRIIHVGLYYM